MEIIRIALMAVIALIGSLFVYSFNMPQHPYWLGIAILTLYMYYYASRNTAAY